MFQSPGNTFWHMTDINNSAQWCKLVKRFLWFRVPLTEQVNGTVDDINEHQGYNDNDCLIL